MAGGAAPRRAGEVGDGINGHEAGIAISTLLRRFPDLQPELDEPQWHPAIPSRGVTLPVSF